MGVWRFTRLTNAFSKKFEIHCHVVALWSVWYNWVSSSRDAADDSGAAAGITNTWHDGRMAGQDDRRSDPGAEEAGSAKGQRRAAP